jgi:hypothetical protein
MSKTVTNQFSIPAMLDIDKILAQGSSPDEPEVVTNVATNPTFTTDVDAHPDDASPYVYSSYAVKFGLQMQKDVVAGYLMPGQFVPIWKSVPAGSTKTWRRMAAAQIFQWSMVVADKKAWLADLSRDDQYFKVSEFVDSSDQPFTGYPEGPEAGKIPSDCSLLMAPGGRVIMNVRGDSPYVAPFKHQERVGADGRWREVDAMAAGAWLRVFAQSDVQQGQETPKLHLYALAPDDTMSGVTMLHCLVSQLEQPCLQLELPLTLEYADILLKRSNRPDSVGREQQEELQRKIQRGVDAYLDQVFGKDLPVMIGIGWADTIQDPDFDVTARHADKTFSNKLLYRQAYEHPDARRFAVRRLRGYDQLSVLRNGRYEPDLLGQ